MKLKLTDNQNLWFCSDPHYNHKNLCRGVSEWSPEHYTRDFPTVKSMNYALVSNINECAKENDVLVCLGDWSFGGFDSIKEFRDQIKCKNIYLVLGNHDHHIERNKNNCRELFTWVGHYLELNVTKIYNDQMRWLIKGEQDAQLLPYKLERNFAIMHYPIASWNNLSKGWIHVHGHLHLINPEHEGKSMDVGLDGNYMRPYSLKEVVKKMDLKPIKNLTLTTDHHETV